MSEFTKFLKIQAYIMVYVDPEYPKEEDGALTHPNPVIPEFEEVP